ncbi:MAG: hypothetical protein H0V01_13310 [Bacteroidetes bacterium]|nr:hypothetical protein [Bacteroidota bacterium]HET6244093.1 hypothetical protein [Bacteroidia bacterium]
MKNIIRFALISTAFFSPFTVNTGFSQCKSKEIVKSSKTKLQPYKYSGAAVNDFIIDDKSKMIDIEFTVYEGQEYRLVFCPSLNLTQDIKISIYDKRKNFKSRKLIFETSSKSENPLFFDPPKSGNYYIEYTIPANENPETKSEGCMVLMIGYQTKK